jgi:hypothetical protein
MKKEMNSWQRNLILRNGCIFRYSVLNSLLFLSHGTEMKNSVSHSIVYILLTEFKRQAIDWNRVRRRRCLKTLRPKLFKEQQVAVPCVSTSSTLVDYFSLYQTRCVATGFATADHPSKECCSVFNIFILLKASVIFIQSRRSTSARERKKN